MDAASSKSRPRKSMRVATIFTGVAATTVGMTQVATAQDTAYPAVRHASRHIGHAIPAGRLSGSIRYDSDCGNRGIDTTWLHVSTDTGSSIVPYTSYCFGGKGIYVNPPGVGIEAECGGNNHGWLIGSDSGVSWSTTYGAGTTYRKLHHQHLYDVAISGWAGTDKCPKPPNYFD